ncbi:MAG: Negative regulator of tic competence ClpC/MecB [Candidatus Parcubacteria bacterium]|jgi:ATP-dependent Clp protease ATP-binding subunit ClpC
MSHHDPFQGFEEFMEEIAADRMGAETKRFIEYMNSGVIGQERAVRKMGRELAAYNAGLKDTLQPIGSYLFSGPTGSGKTELARRASRFLINPNARRPPWTLLQGGRLKEAHRVSELIGAPAGYVRSDEPGKLSQLRIDEPHFRVKVAPYLEEAFKKAGPRADPDAVLEELYEKHKKYISFLVGDEFEKMHPDVQKVFLHIIEDGELEMADGSVTSFEDSVVVLTCNVGGRKQQEMLSDSEKQLGFARVRRSMEELSDEEKDARDEKIFRRTMEYLEKVFEPEMIGRINENIVVFRALNRAQQMRVLSNMLVDVQKRHDGGLNEDGSTKKAPPLMIHFTDGFREFALDEGVSVKLGLRKMRAAVFRLVTAPLSNALEAGEVRAGDEIVFGVRDKKTVIRRKRGSAIVKLPAPIPVGTFNPRG